MSVASVRRLGRYALHRQIAAGGMASVHLGRLIGPAGFSRTVAIKRLHTQFAQDAHFVTMFLDEARVTGRIVHPNIVSTIDVVQERGELFIVMDFVRGAALSSLAAAAAARGEPVEIDIAAGILLDALAGLHAAHEAIGDKRQPLAVVHRDVSPHNILVGADGLSRIADFGIAKARGRMQSTAEGQIKGKLTYMAPEVIRGEDVDRRVDVYASAVVLWELLAGRKLFSGNEAAVLYDVLEGTIDPPSKHREGLPPGLDDVVLKGLSKDRRDRYATAADLAEALEGVVSRAPARRIGAWAAELAAQDIELRAGLIEDLESSSDDAPPLSATATPDPASDSRSDEARVVQVPVAVAAIAVAADPSAASEASTAAATSLFAEPLPVPSPFETSPRRAVQTLQTEDGTPDHLGAAPRGALRTYAIAGTGLALGILLAVVLLRPDAPATIATTGMPSATPIAPPSATPVAPPSAPLLAPSAPLLAPSAPLPAPSPVSSTASSAAPSGPAMPSENAPPPPRSAPSFPSPQAPGGGSRRVPPRTPQPALPPPEAPVL